MFFDYAFFEVALFETTFGSKKRRTKRALDKKGAV